MISPETLEKLGRFDTPTICNVIELFDVRPRNTGFMDSRIQAGFPELPPMVGFAATAAFRSDAPLSQNYRDYIRSWLTGDGTGQGVVWHSRFDLADETLDLFRTKALAIVNEHMITVRLRELGYPVVDVTWLANRLTGRDPGEIDWHTPWDRQVAERFA